MLRTKTALLGMLLVASLGVGCGGDDDGDDGQDDGDDGGTVQDPTDPELYGTPDGEELAFGVQEGDIRNYFRRQGAVAVHLLTRSGADARVVAAFPANNQGIGIWFSGADEDTQLWAGAADESDLTAGGGLEAVVRTDEDAARDLNGVRATLRSDAASLTAYLPVLANVRTVRDYGYGLCLENAEQFPELRNETIELIEEHNAVVIRREQIGGDHAMELLIKGAEGTTLSVREEQVEPREACAATAGEAAEKLVEISGEGGLEFDVIALADDEPLTPIEKPDLLIEQPPEGFEFEHNGLAFLSYAEKLQAGSWRFLTYFGRDTLLSTRMLMPGLQSPIVEAAIRSVLERVNLVEGVPDPNFEFVIEVGDVAHEEELGDFAAWKNLMEGAPEEELRDPRFDYKMVDDDFLLAPVVVEFIEKLAAEDPDGAEATIAAFLAQTRADGATFQQAIEANLNLVLERARPFADDPRGPGQKTELLVALKENVPVGQWRDSDQGIAYGRVAFDVNAALVPGALEAAETLYERFGREENRAEAERILAEWQGIEELFRIDLALGAARNNVADYAATVEVTDTSDQLEADQGSMYSYYGIALDGEGNPLPVLHTDHGFVMEFARPSAEYLARVAATISNDFPAGLMSPVGVMVANPALAAPDTMVTNPGDPSDPEDDTLVALRDIFDSSQYHGTVVWSWQQAMLASGIRRQIERGDLDEETVTALEEAECVLWRTIDAAEAVRAGELWSWVPADGQPEYRAFGFNRNDVDESNAVQLWSTVYLVVKPPTPEQNPLCAE